MSRDNDAENSNVCRFDGSAFTIRRMSGKNPMSSIRSASSSTRNCMPEKSPFFRPIKSNNRPGVATTMSTPDRNAWICGCSPAPPLPIATDDDRVEARKLLPPMELQAQSGRQDFDLHGDAKALFEKVAKSFGLDCLFDDDFQPGPSFRFQ